MERDSLKQRTFFSVIWTAISVGWSAIAMFVIFAVLTRLLDPHVFGIYALSTVFLEVTKIIATGGLSDAVIREKALDEELADTAFWANVGFGALAGLAVFVLADPYAAVIAQPEVAPVLRWLAPFIPITSLAGIHMARKLKDFGHKVVTIRTVTNTFLGGGAAILSAYIGLGVWSLVIQAAVNSVLGVIFAWQSFRWVPSLRFSWRRLRSILSFSSSIMITRILWLLLVRVQDIFIGRSLGAEAVGNYRVAWRTMDLIGQAVVQPMGSVALVTFSHLQDEQKRFEAAYRRMTGLASLLTFPLIFGYGLLSTEFIRVLFGSKWGDSAIAAKVLVLMAIPFTLNYFTGPAIAAKGASRATLMVAALQLSLTVVLSFVAAPFGLAAVAGAYVIRAYLTMPYGQYALYKYTAIHPLKSLSVVWPPFVASLCMIGVLLAASPLLHDWFSKDVAFLIANIMLGAVVYFVGLLLFGRSLLASHINALSPLLAPMNSWRQQAVSWLRPMRG